MIEDSPLQHQEWVIDRSQKLDLRLDVFANLIEQIVDNDTNYKVRYGLILHALHLAHQLGYEAGIRIDPDEPQWPVVYIELPTGQASWHMPSHRTRWDGHDTREKRLRCREFIRQVRGWES